MKNKEFIADFINRINDDVYSSLRYVFYYGSKEQGADIDLMIVTESDVSNNRLTLGKIDAISIKYAEFVDLCQYLDPVTIEPLFGGDLLLGSNSEVLKIKDEILTIKPKQQRILDYLLSRAYMEYVNCLRFIDKNYSKRSLLQGLTNLSWAFSYYYLSEAYENESIDRVAILKDLLETKGSRFNEVFIYLKNSKKDPGLINHEKVLAHVGFQGRDVVKDELAFSTYQKESNRCRLI